MPKKSSRNGIPVTGLNPVQRVMQQAQELDNRRHHQIINQIAAINRILAAWKGEEAWTYDDEMETIHTLLAAEQARAADLESQVRELKEGDDVGKRKDAFLAGFAAGETEDDAQESWKEYKAGLESEEDADDSGDGDE